MTKQKWKITIRLFPKTRLRKLIQRNAPSLFVPNRKATEELLNELNPDLFEGYKSSVALTEEFFSPFNNIEILNEKIKEANLFIKQEKFIPADWFIYNTDKRTLNDFFITNDNCYVEVHDAITKFKTNSLELCKLMEPSDNAEVGLYEHYLRILTKVLINIQAITIVLLEISLTKM